MKLKYKLLWIFVFILMINIGTATKVYNLDEPFVIEKQDYFQKYITETDSAEIKKSF